MSDGQKYYTVLYCRNGGATSNGSTIPIVDDCDVMDDFNVHYVKSVCDTYSSDFIILTEYEGLEASFNTVYDYAPAKLISREPPHYVPRGTDYATL